MPVINKHEGYSERNRVIRDYVYSKYPNSRPKKQNVNMYDLDGDRFNVLMDKMEELEGQDASSVISNPVASPSTPSSAPEKAPGEDGEVYLPPRVRALLEDPKTKPEGLKILKDWQDKRESHQLHVIEYKIYKVSVYAVSLLASIFCYLVSH